MTLLKTSEELNNIKEEARSTILAFERDGNVSSRAVLVSEILKKQPPLDDPERGLLEFFLAYSRIESEQLESGRLALNELLARLEVCQNPLVTCFAHAGLAGCYLMTSEFQKADKHLAEAVCDGDSMDHRYLRVSVNIKRGTLLARTGETRSALDFLRDGVEKAHSNGFIALEERGHHFLVAVYMANGSNSLALESCLERRRLLQLIGEEPFRVLAARIQELSLRLELEQFDIAQAEAESMDTPDLPSLLRIPLETILARLDAHAKDEVGFRSHISNAETLAKQLNRMHPLTNVYSVAAEQFIAFDHLEEAVEWATKSYELAVSVDDHYHAAESSNLLYESHKKLGHLKEALEFLEAYNRISKKNKDDELQRHLELADLRMELDMNRRASEAKDKEAERIKAELEHRSQQLTDRTRHLVAQAGVIEKFRGELKEVLRQSPQNDSVVKQIRQRLLDLPEFRMNYEEFDTQFSEVHPDFMKRLVQQYPMLTRSERRVCPLLLLNLKSFEIGTLLSVDERSIETHRFNIRKKLGLKKEQNVSDFLREI